MSSITVTDFYSGVENNVGLHYNDIIHFSQVEFEKRHDFIQWMFPTRELSLVNVDAALITDLDVENFKDYKYLRDRFAISISIFRNFLDLDREFTPTTLPHWVTPTNHNLLRITRALHAIRELHRFHLKSFYSDILRVVKCDTEDVITNTTLEFWLGAVIGKKD